MSEQNQFSSPSKSDSSETIPSTSKSISNLTRIQRNVAEKQRRDKLNGYISELANIVPMVSMSSKRLDKTSILRLSAAHLRLSKSPLSGTKNLKKSFKWCPSFLTAQQVREILESVDGFLIVTSSSGKILFTSGSVERYLGHQNIDMIGHSLFVFIHPEDLDSVKEEMERLLIASLKCNGSGPTPRCSFRCRMKEKGQPRSEVSTYQFVQFAGDMTISNDEETSNKNTKSTAVITHIFKAFVRVVDANPYSELSLEDATADEYVTRHSLDGTIIFADHRLSTITGHLPQEVTGSSAYKYIIPEDISIALFAHHLMFSSDKGTGMIVYRLRTQDDKYVYLKSVGCLQFDRATSQVDHFVCVNQYLSDAEGEAQLKYFVDRFIPHIKDSSALTLFESVKALQVMGLQTPNTIAGIKESLPFNRLSTSADHTLIESNTMKKKNSHNSEASKITFNNSSNFPGLVNCSVNKSGSSSKCADSIQLSSSTDIFPSKNDNIQTNVLSKKIQCKNKITTLTETDGISRKRRANKNTVKELSVSKIKTGGGYKNSITRELLLSEQSKVIQDNDTISLKIQQSKGLHQNDFSQNVSSIKREIFHTVNNSKDNANHVDCISDFQEISKHTNNHAMRNSNFNQMHVSKGTISNNPKDNSSQISQTDDMHIGLDQYSLKNATVSADSNATNTANVSSMNTQNFPGVKSNIMLSTGLVAYNSDSKTKIQKPILKGSYEFMTLGNDQYATNKVNPNSNQLSVNIKDVVIETNLWPAETSSESSTSNAVSEETFASSVECCSDENNLYFMPEEEMKDYLENSDDISSILNSTLPFDDSSLPSVDGWKECFRPEDVISTSNAEASVHVKMGNNH